MTLLNKDDDFWKNLMIFGIKFNDIWNVVSNIHKKELDFFENQSKVLL